MKLFPKLFRAGAAVLSTRIDELAEDVHAVLDGGLDADSLAPGVALGLGQFSDNRSRFIVRASFGWYPEIIVDLPMACLLVAVSCASMGYEMPVTIRTLDAVILADFVLPASKETLLYMVPGRPSLDGNTPVISDAIGSHPEMALGYRATGILVFEAEHQPPPE